MEFETTDSSIFTQYTLPLTLQKKNSDYPFKNHAQFPLMADILSRKYRHHVFLRLGLSPDAVKYFLEAFLTFLQNEHIPQAVRGMEPVYLSLDQFALNHKQQSIRESDFQALSKILNDEHKHFLLILDDVRFLKEHHQFSVLLKHSNCRCIVVSKNTSSFYSINNDFTQLSIPAENTAESMAILMRERVELENFHRVLIPEELLSLAYSLADRYLCTQNTLEKALLLLDSSAARIESVELTENMQFKPVLTSATVYEVLSDWVNIPATHLQTHKFKVHEFIMAMQQRIFGQEAAITLLGHELQQAQANLRLNSNTFCSLLLAGPKHAGKSALAVALAEQLFQQKDMLFFAQSAVGNIQSITEIKLQSYADKNYLPLKEVIFNKPHAIIMLEDIEQMPPVILEELQEILGSGYVHDSDGRTFNFKHAIFLLTTTLGTKRLNEIANLIVHEEEKPEDVDLVQLIMREQQAASLHGHQYSPQEMADEIMHEVAAYIPAALCQHLHILPFLPLGKSAIENIVRVNLKELGKMLETRYDIELGYAPEVIRFISFSVMRKKDNREPLNKALKVIYFTVEQAILSQADNKNRPNQLLLQLNETGQMLRAEWVAASPMQQHG